MCNRSRTWKGKYHHEGCIKCDTKYSQIFFLLMWTFALLALVLPATTLNSFSHSVFFSTRALIHLVHINASLPQSFPPEIHGAAILATTIRDVTLRRVDRRSRVCKDYTCLILVSVIGKQINWSHIYHGERRNRRSHCASCEFYHSC